MKPRDQVVYVGKCSRLNEKCWYLGRWESNSNKNKLETTKENYALGPMNKKLEN